MCTVGMQLLYMANLVMKKTTNIFGALLLRALSSRRFPAAIISLPLGVNRRGPEIAALVLLTFCEVLSKPLVDYCLRDFSYPRSRQFRMKVIVPTVMLISICAHFQGNKKPTVDEVIQSRHSIFYPSMFGNTLQEVMELQEEK